MATYDFIIVGSGPSGALLASKLAASKEAPQVLLLEAGGDSLTDYPASQRFIVAKAKPELNWGYTTVPQQQLSGQEIDYARGKALGGTTNINFGMWTRPSKGDFEEWAERIGDRFFGWENASRTLDAIERYGHLDDAAWGQYGGRRDQGTGDVPLSFSNDRNEANEVLLNAFANHGSLSHPFTRDINSGELIGTAVIPIMAKDGIYRATAATVYLSNPPANLHIKKNSEVTRVLLDESKTRCIGVETILGQTYLSSKETIISCGALDTPKLLLLSGIGPKAHLSEVGVECKVDLAGVGSNLKDHPLNVLLYKTRDSLDPDLQDIVVSFFRDEKLLESTEATLVLPEDRRLLARPTVAMFEVASAFNFPPGAPVAEPNVAFFCLGMAPQSTGTVRLASANPLDAPLCDPKFHTHQYDRKTAVSSIREVLDIVETGFDGQITAPISAPTSKSHDSINSWLNDTLVSGWHMSSSVKMGVSDDKTACVGLDFKIRGLNGLRVADMSVCPFLPNGHPTSLAYLIGFWAAERIAKDFGLHI